MGKVVKITGEDASQPHSRLDASAWTLAALELLADRGIDGVRVEILARMLGVTKGSFYWHFRDRDALHAAMLERWRRRATLDLIERLDRSADPAMRLRRLLRLPFAGKKSSRAADVELAVRLWGRRDDRARAALEEVDDLRVSYIARLLTECGLEPSVARSRAIMGYSYMRVASTLITADDEATMAACENLLIAGA